MSAPGPATSSRRSSGGTPGNRSGGGNPAMDGLLILKKLAARLLFPLPLILLLLAAGLWLLLRGRNSPRCRRAGWWLTAAAGGLLLFAGTAGGLLLRLYSSGYPVFDAGALDPSRPVLVAVAGSGFFTDETLPPECRFDDSMLLRLREAGRAARLLEARGIPYRIAVSVSRPDAPRKMKSESLTAALGLYGVPPDRVLPVEGAMNSRAEIQAFRDIGGPVVLVSEAFHLPRLMQFARKFHLEAIPAPAAVPGTPGPFSVLFLVPEAENVSDFSRLIYELLGRFEAWLF